MRKHALLFAAMLAVVVVMAGGLLAGEEKIEPVLREVNAAVSVKVTHVPEKGFTVTGDERKNALTGLKGRLALLPVMKDGALKQIGVVTWESTTKETPATWPAITAVKDAKPQIIETKLGVTFKPVIEKTILQGFDVIVVTEKAKPRTIRIAMPKMVDDDTWYGVMLTPTLNDGKLKSFAAVLVSTPRSSDS